MDEESFNQGQGICVLCECFFLPGEDALWHGACFHVGCLMELGDGWMQVYQPDPLPFLLWVSGHSHLEFQSWNGHLIWLSAAVADPEWEAAEAEYGPNALESFSHNGEDELSLKDSEGDATTVSAVESAEDGESMGMGTDDEEDDISLTLSSDDE